uniref:Uncharacterized protein n=1 Tax=Fagus sylvatica TaxID=28930 RepID=A0A2N9IX05_FAGSY
MDPNTPVAEGEDFIHIENLSVDNTLSESIVSVEQPQINDGGGDWSKGGWICWSSSRWLSTIIFYTKSRERTRQTEDQEREERNI